MMMMVDEMTLLLAAAPSDAAVKELLTDLPTSVWLYQPLYGSTNLCMALPTFLRGYQPFYGSTNLSMFHLDDQI